MKQWILAKFLCDRVYFWATFYATGYRVLSGLPHIPVTSLSQVPPPPGKLTLFHGKFSFTEHFLSSQQSRITRPRTSESRSKPTGPKKIPIPLLLSLLAMGCFAPRRLLETSTQERRKIKTDLGFPFLQTTCGQKCFSFRGLVLWNGLDTKSDFKNSNNLNPVSKMPEQKEPFLFLSIVPVLLSTLL